MKEQMQRMFGTVIEFDPWPSIRLLNHQRFGLPIDMKYSGPVVRFVESDGKVWPIVRIGEKEFAGPALQESDPLDAGAGLA